MSSASAPKRHESETSYWKTILWAALLIISVAGCSYQSITILTIFFRYPINVIVSIKSLDSLTLPGITVCSTLGVRLSELKKMSGFIEEYNAQEKKVEASHDQSSKYKMQQIIDKYYNQYVAQKTAQELTKSAITYSELFNMSYTKCAFEAMRPDAVDLCKKYSDFKETLQGDGQKCFTLFHESDPGDITSKGAPFGYSQSPVLMGGGSDGALDVEISELSIQPNEVIRLKINFTNDESTSLNEPASGEIVIHDPTVIPTARRKRRNYIMPGRFYEIYITEHRSILLEAPYKDDCQYYNGNLKKYRTNGKANPTTDHAYFDAPLSKEDCRVGCIGKEVVNKCNCWPREIPYLAHESNPAGKMKLCNWTQLEEEKRKNFTQVFKECFSSFEKECRKQCKEDCIERRYNVEKQSVEWPAQERITFSRQKEYLYALRNCCAIVSVRYLSGEYTEYQSTPKYEPIEFLSYIGGIVSLWLSFSVIGIYDYVQWTVQRCNDRREVSESGKKKSRPLYTKIIQLNNLYREPLKNVPMSRPRSRPMSPVAYKPPESAERRTAEAQFMPYQRKNLKQNDRVQTALNSMGNAELAPYVSSYRLQPFLARVD